MLLARAAEDAAKVQKKKDKMAHKVKSKVGKVSKHKAKAKSPYAMDVDTKEEKDKECC